MVKWMQAPNRVGSSDREKELERRVESLQQQLERALAENERLRKQLEQALRANKRSAAPFSKGEPKSDPKPPGRKPGDGGIEAKFNFGHAIALVLLLAGVIAGVIAITQAQRKVPVQYAQRAVGRKVYSGGTSFMPLRVNYSGVMPIIFAQ